MIKNCEKNFDKLKTLLFQLSKDIITNNHLKYVH